MAATIITKEPFPKTVTKEQIEEEISLRIKAGAIRSWVEEQTDNWMLCTEWNVIGEQ
jgi:hypothetical protein